MIYTYLIKSIKMGTYYTGISSDPNRRLREHNNGKLKTTSRNKPYILIYSKPHLTYAAARNHEIWLKKKNQEYKNKLYMPE